MKKQKEQQSKKKMNPLMEVVMKNKAFRESFVHHSKTEDRYIVTGLKEKKKDDDWLTKENIERMMEWFGNQRTDL